MCDKYQKLEEEVREKLELNEEDFVIVFFTDKEGNMKTEETEETKRMVFVNSDLLPWDFIFTK